MWEIIKSGGPLMIPLGICSVLSLSIIIERLINLRESRVIKQKEIMETFLLIQKEDFEKARLSLTRSKTYFSEIIKAVLDNPHLKGVELRELVIDTGRQITRKLESYLEILSTIASISPLLGLLGTVTGMIKVFSVIKTMGVGQAEALSGGIAEALITTATGLTIAIPTLVMYNYFMKVVDGSTGEMEKHASQLIRLIDNNEGSAKGGDNSP